MEDSLNPMSAGINFVLQREFSRVLEKTTPASFEQIEQSALQLANELVRHHLESELAQQEIKDAEVLIDGKRYRRHEAARKTYYSLCGGLSVVRASYRQVGVHNGPTVVPLELAAGLIEGATPALAGSVAHGFATLPSRQYAEHVAAAHRVLPSRSTVERLGKRLAIVMQDALPRLEFVLRETEALPKGAASISLGLDPMPVG